jgi:hypothetical protein
MWEDRLSVCDPLCSVMLTEMMVVVKTNCYRLNYTNDVKNKLFCLFFFL